MSGIKQCITGITLAIAMSSLPISAEETANCDTVCQFQNEVSSEASLVGEIWSMNRMDRHERRKAIALVTSPDIANEERAELGNRLFQIIGVNDQKRTDRLKEILETTSWADMHEIDDDLPNRAWLIAQHASHDPNFQKSVLASITPMVQRGQMDAQTFAQMTDEVALNEGEAQIYGTQYDCIDGSYQAFDLADPGKVNERREELSLVPLEDYLQEAVEVNGPCSA